MSTIHVRLLNEGTEVWKPVSAEELSPEVFKILDIDYDDSDESWEFLPGQIVKCRNQNFADEESGMVAFELLKKDS